MSTSPAFNSAFNLSEAGFIKAFNDAFVTDALRLPTLVERRAVVVGIPREPIINRLAAGRTASGGSVVVDRYVWDDHTARVAETDVKPASTLTHVAGEPQSLPTFATVVTKSREELADDPSVLPTIQEALRAGVLAAMERDAVAALNAVNGGLWAADPWEAVALVLAKGHVPTAIVCSVYRLRIVHGDETARAGHPAPLPE